MGFISSDFCYKNHFQVLMALKILIQVLSRRTNIEYLKKYLIFPTITRLVVFPKNMAEEETNCKGYSIRQMTTNDISGALQVFASHGLFEAKNSLLTYLQMDCNGFYVAIDSNDNQVIGVCGGPFLRPDSAFIGLYAVRKENFGQKIGQKLFKCVMNYIGDKNCGLFAVPDKIGLYRDGLGFRVESNKQMVIYFGKGMKNSVESDINVKLEPIISQRLVEKVINFDESIHHYRRETLLRLSLKESGCLSLAAVDQSTGDIIGYGCIRENSSNFATLSPVYANNKTIAKQIVVNLINLFEIAVKNGFFYYTIDANESAIELAQELGLEKHEDCPLLYRKSVVDINYQKIYTILSPNFSF